MKRLLTAAAAALLLWGCAEKAVEEEPIKTEKPSFVGNWKFTLPPVVASIPDTTVIQLKFTAAGTDTAASILMTQRTNGIMRTIYSSGGTVHSTSDSITVISENCMVWDTVSSQLVPLDGTLCGTPFSLSLSGLAANEWLIHGKNFVGVPILSEKQKGDIQKISLKFLRIE